MPTIDNEIKDIRAKISRFGCFIKKYKEGSPGTRYKSWEWCYKQFGEAIKSIKGGNVSKDAYKELIDKLSLHLAFYLASWGMYRGSSYLLDRDYKAHKPAIMIILRKKIFFSKRF